MSPAFYPYSSDSNERQHFIAHAALLAVLLAFLLHLLKDALAREVTIPWFIELPTFAGLTWAIYRLAVRRWWRQPWFRFLFGVEIPDLNGTWVGHFISSHDTSQQTECSLKIEQTWDSIGLIFKTGQSRSCNGITGIAVKSPGGARLVYEYTNIPNAITATKTMHQHEGTQWLTLSKSSNGLRLSGDYYTGRDRKTYGSVDLRHVSTS